MKPILKSVAIFLLMGMCFAFFSDVCFLFKNTMFYIFQVRDIKRAIDILHGKFIFFGPELTGGGHLPGPLYYYLMSIALWIKESWISVWILQYISIFISCLIVYFYYFKKNVSNSIAFLWLILFASHPFTSWFIRIFLNVSMMLPFAVCTLMLVLGSFSDKSYNDRKKLYYAACFGVGLGLQFHFSLIFYFIASMFLHLFSRPLKIPTLKKTHIVIGVGLLLLPLLPYYAWIYFPRLGFRFGVEAFNTGEAKEVMGTLWYLAENGFEFSGLLKAQFWTQKIIFTIPFSIFILLFSADFKKNWRENKVLIICFLFSLLPFSLWFVSPQAIRYTILTYVSAIFIALKLFQNVIEDNEREEKFVKVGLVLGVVIAVAIFFISDKILFLKDFIKILFYLLASFVCLALINWNKVRINKKYLAPYIVFCFISFIPNLLPSKSIFKFNDKDKYMPSVDDWQHIWTAVRRSTGWSYEEARKRLYFIGHHMSQGAELGFESVSIPIGDSISSLNISGFIISNRRVPKSFESDLNWILRQNLPSEIVVGIKDKRIILQASISNKILIMPYNISPETKLPEFFQNISEGYRQSSEEVELEKVSGNEGVVKLDEKNFIFKWNECPDHNKFCSTGVFLEVLKENKYDYKINTKVVGSSLAQITPWISPDWNQAWIRPYIQINCGDKKSKYEMASSIGYNRRLSHNVNVPFFQGNNSILAPFEFRLKFKCSSQNVQVLIGRENSLIDMVTQIKQLPGKELSLSL